jgi:hypothetical protein
MSAKRVSTRSSPPLPSLAPLAAHEGPLDYQTDTQDRWAAGARPLARKPAISQESSRDGSGPGRAHQAAARLQAPDRPPMGQLLAARSVSIHLPSILITDFMLEVLTVEFKANSELAGRC